MVSLLDQIPLVHYPEPYRVNLENSNYGKAKGQESGIRIAAFESIEWSTHLD